MTWFKFTKMTITLSVDADDEEDAIGKLDSGIWDSNQPRGWSVEIDMAAPPYEGPTKEDD